MKKRTPVRLLAGSCLPLIFMCWLAVFAETSTEPPGAQVPQEPALTTYLQVTGPCGLEFPRDHGAHPGYRSEWWYYTGNVRAHTGQRFGFQLTFFRHQISPPGAEALWPRPPSPWRSSQLYFAHAALTDIDSRRFYQSEVMTRGALSMAGAQQLNGQTTVFIKNWQVTLHSRVHQLQAESDDFQLRLRLEAQKEPVPHGLAGYSRKGSLPESASCYYSISRLSASGTLTVKGAPYEVEGLAWMDHEYSSAPLEPSLVGWDWFSIQLADQSELMIYLLRQHDGSLHPASSGTLVDRTGQTLHLEADAFAVEVLDYWMSPHTGTRYPHGWALRVPSRQLELKLEAQLDDQEMRTTQPANISYWEGSVRVRGSAGDSPLSGTGYAELTGYAGALPMF
jgi:predicted secreted hydrolase